MTKCPHTVFLLQTALKGSGYDPGKIDAIWGAKTQKAFDSFKKNTPLKKILSTNSTHEKNTDPLGETSQPSIVNFTCPHRGGKNAPRTIILHHCGGTWEGTRSWLMRPKGSRDPVSYHYHISESGEIRCYVPPNLIAWHALGHNTGTIGIAFTGDTVTGKFRKTPDLNESEINSAKILIRYLQDRFPAIKKITTHRAVDPKRKNDISPSAELQILKALS